MAKKVVNDPVEVSDAFANGNWYWYKEYQKLDKDPDKAWFDEHREGAWAAMIDLLTLTN